MSVETDVQKKILPVDLHWMAGEHMRGVVAVEQACFVQAWNKDDFQAWMKEHNGVGMVAAHNKEVVGYLLYELRPSRKAVKIVNVAVYPAYQRLGVGSRMIKRLLGKLESHRCTKAEVIVRERNLAAQLFFRGHRFKHTYTLPAYCKDTGEDAYRMVHCCA